MQLHHFMLDAVYCLSAKFSMQMFFCQPEQLRGARSFLQLVQSHLEIEFFFFQT